MLTKQIKSQHISEVSSHFEKAQASFVVNFQGLNVEQITDLRNQLRSKKSQMKVVRNTLVRRALEGNDMKEKVNKFLSGTNAFIFAFEDISGTAKVLSEFADDTPLALKTGLVGEKLLSEQEIERLASLPSLEELRAQLLSVLSAPAQRLLRVFNEVPSSFVRVLSGSTKK
ncbi:MAG: 50S ribosomal protein L10 [Bdellovibrionales bacterium]|nr:50S ribosomal protein L10 [Bdellovibrionales bacterium]